MAYVTCGSVRKGSITVGSGAGYDTGLFLQGKLVSTGFCQSCMK